MTQTFSISELAREFDVTPRTIRYYEAEGMLDPERQGQRRIYSPRNRVTLALILRGKRLGFSLAEAKEIIELYDAPQGEAQQCGCCWTSWPTSAATSMPNDGCGTGACQYGCIHDALS